MNVEDLTADLRVRSHWEAADLGCVLVQRSFLKLWMLSLLTLLPTCALFIFIAFVLQDGNVAHAFWTALFFIWLFKPQFERPILRYLGHDLFGAPPRIRTLLKSWPLDLFRRPLWMISTRLRYFNRSQLLAIDVLEHCKGKTFKPRASHISIYGGAQGSSLSVVIGPMLEIILMGTFLFVLQQFVPTLFQIDIQTSFIDALDPDTGIIPQWMLWTTLGLYVLSISILQLFYVGAGFGLYLNSRARLEGWDIEIAFKRLARRIAPMAPPWMLRRPAEPPTPKTPNASNTPNASTTDRRAASLSGTTWVFLLFLLPLAAPQTPANAQPASTPETVIENILDHEDFQEKYRIIKVLKPRSGQSTSSTSTSSRNSGGLEFLFPGLGRTFFILISTVFIAFILFYLYKNRHIFPFIWRRPPPRETHTGPTVVMGLDVAPESLPDDILTEARNLWDAGQTRAALSLLYRGCLSRLIERHRVPIRDSDTEHDCLRRVHSAITKPGPLPDYTEALTRHWVHLAYGDRPPSSSDIDFLLQTWPFNEDPAGGAA